MAGPTNDTQRRDAVERLLRSELPRRAFASPGRFFREIWTSPAPVDALRAASMAPPTLLAEVALEKSAIGPYPALVVRAGRQADDVGSVGAAVLALGTRSHEPSGWESVSNLRYYLLERRADSGHSIIELLADGTRREADAIPGLVDLMQRIASPPTRRAATQDRSMPALALADDEESIVAALDTELDFGSDCLACGADCGEKRTSIRATKTLQSKVFCRAKVLRIPWCRRCRWRTSVRNGIVLLSAAGTVGAGYLILGRGFGWWPTSRGGQKFLILGLAGVGAIIAVFAQEDTDPPVKAEQSRDSVALTFADEDILDRCARRWNLR